MLICTTKDVSMNEGTIKKGTMVVSCPAPEGKTDTADNGMVNAWFEHPTAKSPIRFYRHEVIVVAYRY